VVTGLLVSHHSGSATGATMALVSVTIFFIVMTGRAFAGRVLASRRSNGSENSQCHTVSGRS
jgi:hypothetical protein